MARTQRRRQPATGAPATTAASAAEGTPRRVRENLPRPSAAPVSAGVSREPARRKSRFGFFTKLQPRFVGDVISELRKVTWPTIAETRYLTIVVAIVAIAVGIVLGIVDLFFGWIIERLFF